MNTTTRIDRVNILLVDDQPSKLLTYETILSGLGETLIRASSATDALECLLKQDIAVVLVDVCMPDLDGYELAGMIRQHPRFQQTSIIFVSAVLMTDLDRIRGYECGAVDYVPVPVVPEILRAKVSVFADLFRKTRALERLNAELEQRVTERTAALEATTLSLQEADRRKDEFLAMVAHELRNPLAPIRTAAQLLKVKELAEAHQVRARDIIERQVEHLVCLIDDLLDVSRITRGVITLRREPVLIGAVVARAVEGIRHAIDARHHEFRVELVDELLAVEGDKTRLVQVLGNLLHNAAKFTDTGGRIVLKVERDGRNAVIRVKDSGIGMSPQTLPRVFDLFTRVHPTTEPGEGLGIGLALVRRLVEMHGGAVSAHSDGLGQGAEFVVTLPLVAIHNVSQGEPVQPPALPKLSALRIVVADDNHDSAEALATLLHLHGHDVRVANDGVEALRVAEAFQPDVVLLDLGMPKMDGYETARLARTKPWGKSVLIVALTGWGQDRDRQRTAEAGFDAHLIKPVTDIDLFQLLASANAASSSS